MRDFVQHISSNAKSVNPGFYVIPQNGLEIVLKNDNRTLDTNYINSIDGAGREDLFYGYNDFNQLTPAVITNFFANYLDIIKNSGKKVLVTDYCSTVSFIDDSYLKNDSKEYTSFAAATMELTGVPRHPSQPHNLNRFDITNLSFARNFLYLLNPGDFPSKVSYLNTLRNSNYDLLIIDAFYNDTLLSMSEVNSLKTKQNGGKRLIISYLSIGEAENYRYYWNSIWITNPPTFLASENPQFPGNYKVQYWMNQWQNIIFGNNNSYLTKILNSGFDGAYLDIIDAYEYFE